MFQGYHSTVGDIDTSSSAAKERLNETSKEFSGALVARDACADCIRRSPSMADIFSI
jgi:hypothetical protein